MSEEKQKKPEEVVTVNAGRGYASEAMLKLDAMEKTIDTSRVDMDAAMEAYAYSPAFADVIPYELRYRCARYALAQAKIDGIITTEAGAVIRSIMPGYDFVDNNGRKLQNNDWRTPTQGEYNSSPYAFFDAYSTGAMINTLTGEITETHQGRLVHDDMKVMIFFGACKTNKNDPVYIQSIRIMRALVKTIAIVGMEELDVGGVVCFNQPVMFQAGDEVLVRYSLKQDSKGHHDTVALMGYVVEATGATAQG